MLLLIRLFLYEKVPNNKTQKKRTINSHTMVKKIKISGSKGGVILSNDDDLHAFLKKKGVQSLLDNEGFEVITFAPLVSGSTYTLGPHDEVMRPTLRIFDLVFQNIPTGSSGAPHILPRPGGLSVGSIETSSYTAMQHPALPTPPPRASFWARQKYITHEKCKCRTTVISC